VRLLLDENLSHHHAERLKILAFDAISVLEAGLSGAPDEVIRQFAIESSRILVTLDADFANILRFPPTGTRGVIRIKVHPPTEDAIASAIDRALLMLSTQDLTNRLAVIDGNKIRIRR
jgi:predicted nuclease of predicted toxin-antitoxin system